jgi:phage head maturation protease
LERRPGTPLQLDAGAARVDPDTGEIVALAAITGGAPDEVGDEIQPGAFRRSLRERGLPRFCRGHRWDAVIGDVLEAVELMSGDPRLPRRTPAGDPWPPDAGGLLVRARFHATIDGQDAWAIARAAGPDQMLSIGYKALRARRRDGIRLLDDVALFEVSTVLHAAHGWARAMSVKSGRPANLEVKSTSGVAARIVGDRRAATRVFGAGAARRSSGQQVLHCSVCGTPAALVTAGRVATDLAAVCAGCVASATIDDHDLTEPTPSTEDDFAAALRDDRPWHVDHLGRVRRGLHG